MKAVTDEAHTRQLDLDLRVLVSGLKALEAVDHVIE
jgi:hypothetical protein